MSISPVNAFSDLPQDMMCEIARRCDLSSAIALRGVSKGISNMVVNKSPGGSQIVSGSYDKTCRVWTKSLEGKWDSIELSGHKDWVRSVAFSPDGSQIVSGSYDKT